MLHKRSIKEKLLKGGAWAFSGKLVTAFAGLAVNALLARLLTPQDMGAYFLTLSLVTIASILAQFGLTQTVVRFVAESMGNDNPSRARKAIILSLRIVACIAAIVACALFFGVGQWISEGLFKSQVISSVIGLIVVWFLINTFQSLMSEVYRGFHDVRLATIFGGVITGLLSMLVFLGLWMLQGHSDLKEVIMLTVMTGFVSLGFSSFALRRKLKGLPLVENESLRISDIVKVSWPLWISQLMVLAVLQADIWIVGGFLSEEDVALYGAVARLVAFLMMTTTIFYSFMPPIIAEMNMQNKLSDLQSILTTSAFANGILILPVFLCFIFYSSPILGFIYGEYYMKADSILSILAIGFFFNAITGMRGIVLMLTGHEKTQMFISSIGGIMNISFCMLGAWKFGLTGVAYGAMFGVILQALMELVAVKRTLGIWTFGTPLYIKEFIGLYTNRQGDMRC